MGVRSSPPLPVSVAAVRRQTPNKIVEVDKCECSAELASQPSLEAIAASDAEASLSEACPDRSRREPGAVISHAGIRAGEGRATALPTATGRWAVSKVSLITLRKEVPHAHQYQRGDASGVSLVP